MAEPQHTVEVKDEERSVLWKQDVLQNPKTGAVDIQMQINPELQRFLEERHYKMLQDVVQRVVSDMIAKAKAEKEGRSTTSQIQVPQKPLIQIAKY